MEAQTAAPWPGNIRELENFIERTVILTQGDELKVPISELKRPAMRSSAPASTFHDAERQTIIDALKAAAGRIAGQRGAAERLGLKRTTLQNKMRKLNISKSDYQTALYYDICRRCADCWAPRPIHRQSAAAVSLFPTTIPAHPTFGNSCAQTNCVQSKGVDDMLAILDFLFGCHHPRLSRVFTIGRKTYRVCTDCGATFNYSLNAMRMESRRSTSRNAAFQPTQQPEIA